MKRIIRGILLIAIFSLPIGLVNAQEADTTSYNSDSIMYNDIVDTISEKKSAVKDDSAEIYVDEELDTVVVYNRDTLVKKSDVSKEEEKDTTTQKQKQEKIENPPERGLYIGLGLGIGVTDFHYNLQGINGDGAGHRMRLGGQVGINAAYYFTRHWGISLGVGVSLYRSTGQYKGLKSGNYFDIGAQYINDERMGFDSTLVNIHARLLNWQELEQSYFVDIPLMLQYQTKWKKGKNGLYFGIGVKYQLPFNAKYRVIDSKYKSQNNDDPDTWRLNISIEDYLSPNRFGDLGAINAENGTLGVEVPEHGIGTITNPNELLNWNGKLSIKGSWTGIAELGFLFGLTRRVDLTLGAYFEYGFNNIEKGDDKALLTVQNNYLSQFNNNVNSSAINKKPVGTGIDYVGLIGSTQTKRTNLMSVGLKVGLRVKIGKFKARDPYQEEPEVVEKKAIKDSTPEDPLKKLEDLLKNLLDQPNQNQPSTLIIKEDGNPNTNPQNYPNNPNNSRKVVGNDGYYPSNHYGLTPQEIATLECCIYFDYAKADIRPSEIWCLEQKLAILKAHPEIKMRILGNTCDMYGDDINVPLGQRRAQAAKEWLMQKGISGDRLISITQSKYQPQVANDSESHRKLNRRADFEIVEY